MVYNYYKVKLYFIEYIFYIIFRVVIIVQKFHTAS